MVTLREYQKDAYSKLNKIGVNLLSICPGGGKTEVAIKFILDNPQFKRVLILSHGTNVLKSQWSGRLSDYKIPFSADIKSKERIVIIIPQSIQPHIRISL